MSKRENSPVLIEQNRNTINRNLNCRNTLDTRYVTLQCDGIPRPNQSIMRSPSTTTTGQHSTSNNNDTVKEKTKEHSSDGTEPSNCLDIYDICNRDTEKNRVRLVKLYAWIKDEMTKTAAGTIANYLFMSECKYLSAAAHESIHRCTRRREAVEQLLKKILMGPENIFDVFIEAMKKQADTYISDRLNTETVSDDDIDVFIKLEQSSLGKCDRPDYHLPRLTFSKSDEQTLRYHLYDKDIIEQVNDRLLSLLIFSIREHTNVVNCSLDKEKKVKELIKTMCKCSDNIFKDFCEILVSIEEPHVVQKLEKRVCDTVKVKQRKKRKSPTGVIDESDDPDVSSMKRQCMSSTDEYNLVSSLRNSPSNLQKAVNTMGFDVEAVNKGSIVIQISPKNEDAWQRLEENCKTGKIKDFIPVVYSNDDVQEMMEEGEYKIKFTIYTLPSPQSNDSKKAMFHLEPIKETSSGNSQSKQSTDHHGNLLEKNSSLLCEELEITKNLLNILKDEGLVSSNITQELDKIGSRAKKIKCLLKKLGCHGNRGFEVIKDYVKVQNPSLYKDLKVGEDVECIENKIDSVATVTESAPVPKVKHRCANKKEIFFTATVVLVIKKNDHSDPDNKDERVITCTDIIEPVCYFESRDKDTSGHSEQVTLVLEDAWTMSNSKGPQRKIAQSSRKRKNEQSTDVGRKRTTSENDTDNDDNDADDVIETKPEYEKIFDKM
ncbi:hypothetical protein ACF0H5_008900 [Mactra antiquata]